MKTLTTILAFALAMLFAAPAHALVKVKSGQSINLTWLANLEPDIAEYEIQRADSVDGPWTEFATVTGTGHLVQTLDLPEGDSVFALIVIDDVGNRSVIGDASEIVRNDNTAPAQPATITITVVAE